jgi:cephalosporin hydroxylase
MHKDDRAEFRKEMLDATQRRAEDSALTEQLLLTQIELTKYSYGYSFTWLGLPIIRFPDDILVYQELVWQIKPDLIIEVGVARGGSVLLSATLQSLIGNGGETVGIDIDIRPHNRMALQEHPSFRNISLLEGDSLSSEIVSQVRERCAKASTVVLVLDGNHTHSHVLEELRTYSSLLPVNSYIVLPDTMIEFYPRNFFSEQRPWNKGNNPFTAMEEFLQGNDNFVIDHEYSNKAAITETKSGYLRRIR